MNKEESIMSALAIALLLFTAMIDPIVSVSLAILLLIIFFVYKYLQSDTTSKKRKK